MLAQGRLTCMCKLVLLYLCVSQVLPLYIKTASVFCGRIIRKEDDDFNIIASQMTSYYADKKKGAEELLEGGLYAVQEDDVFHRFDINPKYKLKEAPISVTIHKA